MLSLYSIYDGKDDRNDEETEKASRHNMWTLVSTNYVKIKKEVYSGLLERKT